MKQISRIISTYSADTFGVCSALFELGGMVVMHDASGCNSTYTTHEEPRWYEMESMVYLSGLTEMEAVMGDDEKLLGDIETAAKELQPKFLAIAGTPIPAMTGFDFSAAARLLEERTGILSFGFGTTGMHTYVQGASMALEALARRVVEETKEKTPYLSANILGLTPLDFSINGSDRSIGDFLGNCGFQLISRWAMGSSLEEIAKAGRASVNLVVSASGLGAAKVLKERFGTPFVVGVPMGKQYQACLRDELFKAVSGEDCETEKSDLSDKKIAVIGEGISSVSLAQALELTYANGVKVLCATECEKTYLRRKDILAPDEETVTEGLKNVKIVIADPLYQPVCPENVKFIPLPAENFSGRLYREKIPNLIDGFEDYFGGILV